MPVVLPEAHTLPDGTPLPATAYFINGTVQDWTGTACRRCTGTGEHVHPFDRSDWHSCRGCGGTGEGHDQVWRWEE